jgi:hypothetical protein
MKNQDPLARGRGAGPRNLLKAAFHCRQATEGSMRPCADRHLLSGGKRTLNRPLITSRQTKASKVGLQGKVLRPCVRTFRAGERIDKRPKGLPIAVGNSPSVQQPVSWTEGDIDGKLSPTVRSAVWALYVLVECFLMTLIRPLSARRHHDGNQVYMIAGIIVAYFAQLQTWASPLTCQSAAGGRSPRCPTSHDEAVHKIVIRGRRLSRHRTPSVSQQFRPRTSRTFWRSMRPPATMVTAWNVGTTRYARSYVIAGRRTP